MAGGWRAHITAWEFEGNIRPINWTEGQASRVGGGVRRNVVRKASTQQNGLQDSGWAALENEKDTMLTAITLGSKYFNCVRSPAPSHMQTLSNPFRTLAIKWEVNIFIKKSSCVFIIASVYHCVGMYPVYIYVYFCMNQQITIQHMDSY